ncbi:amidohydrolase family protein [Congregibacter variabilis]|uniref:Amidohydrolase family protein n=1 Tax=Congregibacter variabilis TaxID=3081200 RepID=A0ABZ0I0U6_9GAMM|nr:amidohydrolase family protein [Congregibacter sp. IMCC43200]
MNAGLSRRQVLRIAAGGIAAVSTSGCSEEPAPGRYTQADIDQLAKQQLDEAVRKGKGPYGEQRYAGYRGLASLPWFELNDAGNLICVDDSLPGIVDVHAHLGMSILFKPELDLQASTPRVRHLLDCDGTAPPSELDLDIYINGNFSPEALSKNERVLTTQGLWGNEVIRSHTIPNLIAEMDCMRVQHSLVLPIKLGLPFGDDLTEQWRAAISSADISDRLMAGCSVHPQDPDRVEQLHQYAATGARVVKLHPTVQRFYPDDPSMMPLYEEAQRLGMVIFFHGGRAGIEPESSQRYAVPRHYAKVLRDFPRLQVILGHAGARDSAGMLELALAHQNAWLGIHGQGVTSLDTIIARTGGERLLFGTDWPWYHLGATLAKVLICTDSPQRMAIRSAILRDNAMALLPDLAS